MKVLRILSSIQQRTYFLAFQRFRLTRNSCRRQMISVAGQRDGEKKNFNFTFSEKKYLCLRHQDRLTRTLGLKIYWIFMILTKITKCWKQNAFLCFGSPRAKTVANFILWKDLFKGSSFVRKEVRKELTNWRRLNQEFLWGGHRWQKNIPDKTIISLVFVN